MLYVSQRSLRLQKKVYDKTITELEQKAIKEAVDSEVLENLGQMVRAKAGIERKLSTTYSLGRDRAKSQSKSILPLYDRKTKSFSFRSRKKENTTIANTLSDSSSEDCSICEKATKSLYIGPPNKGKAPMEVVDNSSGDDSNEGDYESVSADSTPGSNLYLNPLFNDQAMSKQASLKIHDEEESAQNSGSSSMRRRTLSSSS